MKKIALGIAIAVLSPVALNLALGGILLGASQVGLGDRYYSYGDATNQAVYLTSGWISDLAGGASDEIDGNVRIGNGRAAQPGRRAPAAGDLPADVVDDYERMMQDRDAQLAGR